MTTLTTRLRGVLGDKTSKPLASAFGMETVGDLLRHYPRRYVGIGELSDLTRLEQGQYVTILAQVLDAQNKSFGPGGRKVRTEVVVTDGTGRLTLTFFQQRWRREQLKPGTVGLFAGEVSEFGGRLQLTHPIYEPVEDEDGPSDESRLARGIIPIYPATAKMTSFAIEKSVDQCLAVADLGADPLPDSILAARGFAGHRDAFEHIHRPRSNEHWKSARERFKFEEAFVIQTVFAQRRRVAEGRAATARPGVAGGLRDQFAERLPFTLTDGQQAVLDEVSADLGRKHPMHRLLQGEVGSGKTVVALMAMLQVIDSGGQCALLAPTEVLASQHYRGLTSLLGELAEGGMLGGAADGTRVVLVTGSMGAKEKQAALLAAASGEAGIVIGTHALLQDTVQFAELGMLVIDEQHRFGVEQRAALVDRADVTPHVLVMTATPIPRTIAMSVFGDLDVSTLSELPGGRLPIQTTVVPIAQRPSWLERAWQRVVEEVAKGRQVFVVVSRIGVADEQEEKDTRSLLELHAELLSGPLSSVRVGMLHGRMAADEKDAAMRAFSAGDVDVLVATTVVEVGVDVPNATMMVVMDADRFGISQLHQLRGRVGRGTEPGLCLLVTEAEDESPSRERLDAVASTTDGFELSRKDVELRHEGDVLGARQSGIRSSLRLLSVVKDGDVIEAAREAATEVVAADPTLVAHPGLAAAVADVEASEHAEYLERT